MRKLRFAAPVWEDYLTLQRAEPALSARLDQLLDACCRTPYDGIGRPCALASPLNGWWSRRLTHRHRLVYRVVGDQIWVAQCLSKV
ncbi:Txe/YoeB family addiction module toxin [Leisingera sp. S232]|uniref:Txe/YoeB family addiction module toxin n=1 Tax=Leisingera sp. S232 TaxID=3415132 RepID=UPI003C7D1410